MKGTNEITAPLFHCLQIDASVRIVGNLLTTVLECTVLINCEYEWAGILYL